MDNKSNISNKKKIIVNLIGGLGNILYQIAAGYCISKKSNRDFHIYYDGHSVVQDLGSGDLFLAGSVVRLSKNDLSESMVVATEDGSVDLYYDNAKKFETTPTGAVVTGILTATSFEGSGENLTNLPASGDANDITASLFS